MTDARLAWTAQQWNEAHPDEPPLVTWPGGEQAPPDWDCGPVLMRTGVVGPCLRWSHIGSLVDVIGYRRKLAPALTERGEW